MSGTTWVYIMLGIYIIYCFYWGLKGYFSEKTSAGLCDRGSLHPFHRVLDGGDGSLVFRLDLHRSPRPYLA